MDQLENEQYRLGITRLEGELRGLRIQLYCLVVSMALLNVVSTLIIAHWIWHLRP